MSDVTGVSRVIVADDSVLLREGVVRLLTDAGLRVTAAVSDGIELLDRVRADAPDMVVVDIRMPPTHTTEGLQAALEIRATFPEIAIVVLSQYVEPRYAVELLSDAAGGVGYLLKDRVTDSASFLRALGQVAAGGTVVDPEVVGQLLGRPRVSTAIDTLSEREREVLALMAEGRSNAAIAEQLHISPRTLEKHIASVFLKLDIHPESDSHRRVLAVLVYLRRAGNGLTR